jgi:hypothetical protein
VRYHRPEEIHKGRLIESRVVYIIVFLREETISKYKQSCDEEIAEELNEANIPVHISSLISFFFFSFSFFFFFLSLRFKTTISFQDLSNSNSVFLLSFSLKNSIDF